MAVKRCRMMSILYISICSCCSLLDNIATNFQSGDIYYRYSYRGVERSLLANQPTLDMRTVFQLCRDESLKSNIFISGPIEDFAYDPDRAAFKLKTRFNSRFTQDGDPSLHAVGGLEHIAQVLGMSDSLRSTTDLMSNYVPGLYSTDNKVAGVVKYSIDPVKDREWPMVYPDYEQRPVVCKNAGSTDCSLSIVLDVAFFDPRLMSKGLRHSMDEGAHFLQGIIEVMVAVF